jgi:hypothetical protein
MNDEGVTTYYEEINQMSHGAAFLEKELGLALPPHVLVINFFFCLTTTLTLPPPPFRAHSRSAWHIDPFGHSAATASLWSDVGFDGFVLNRYLPPMNFTSLVATPDLM